MITEEATLQDISKHIEQVRKYLGVVISSLELRIRDHDRSKLSDPELSIFAEYNEKLKNVSYGSSEYVKTLKNMEEALTHHYSNNRHHPEFFKDKQMDTKSEDLLSRMNLIDVIEMLCDWMAATFRHVDGDIQKSIALNKKRFSISDQLTSILQNTIELFDDARLLEDAPLDTSAHLIPKVDNIPRI